MEIVERNTDRATVLELSGEIDLSASPEFRAELAKRAEARTPVLLLDFSGVDYIDSSGLAALIEYARSASAHGGRMALFGLQPKVKMVFDLVKLDQLFPIQPDEAAALKACAVD